MSREIKFRVWNTKLQVIGNIYENDELLAEESP
jgi:hypothetical protein